MKQYPIREVSDLTGIKPVTLRAWQRRYGLLKPLRTESGHRLYTEADLDTIRAIQGWLAKGVSIGHVKALLEQKCGEKPEDTRPLLAEVDLLLSALANLHAGKAEAVISQVFKEYPLEIVQQQFITPVLEALERVKVSQRTLQKGLLQSLMQSQLARSLAAENRAATQGVALMLNLDSAGSLDAWLAAVALSERGYNVCLLDGVDELAGLKELELADNVSLVYLFANRRLPARQVELVHSLSDCDGIILECSPMLSQQMA